VFEYSLAERLGMTVAELRQRMSAAEFLEWGRFWTWRAREERWQRQRAQAAAQRRSAAGGPPPGGGR
jgi:hypothetical protein